VDFRVIGELDQRIGSEAETRIIMNRGMDIVMSETEKIGRSAITVRGRARTSARRRRGLPRYGFGRAVRVETVAVSSYRRKVTPVYSRMRKATSDPADMDVYISSNRRRSMLPGRHKMWCAVKDSFADRSGPEKARPWAGSPTCVGGGASFDILGRA
jgi:hypothetical protein